MEEAPGGADAPFADAMVSTPSASGRTPSYHQPSVLGFEHEQSDGSLDQKPSLTLEEAIEAVGVGRTQLLLMLICGLSFCSDAVEITYLSYVTVVLRCEWQLAPWQESLISSAVFFGTILGAPGWGYLGDTIGRRPTFLMSAALIALLGFLTALCQQFLSLLLVRGCVGIAVAGMPISFDILAEALPQASRGRYLLYVEFFWTFGSIWVTLAAFTSLRSAGWQVFTVLCALPALVSFLAGLPLLAESPRWLQSQGRGSEAVAILNKWAAANKVDARFQDLQPEAEAQQCGSEGSLFRGPSLQPFVLMGIVWFSFDVAYYGVVMLLPRLFQHTDDGHSCNVDFDFKDLATASSSETIGVIVALLMVDRCGRKATQGLWYLVAAATLALLGWRSSSEGVLTGIASLGRIAMMAALCVTWVHTPELFPTRVRAQAHTLLNLFSKLGASVAPFLISGLMPQLAAALLMGSFALVAAVAVTFLPETRHLALSSLREVGSTQGTPSASAPE